MYHAYGYVCMSRIIRYDVGEIPESPAALMDSILNDKEAKIDSPEMNVAYRMPVREYEDLTPYRYNETTDGCRNIGTYMKLSCRRFRDSGITEICRSG